MTKIYDPSDPNEKRFIMLDFNKEELEKLTMTKFREHAKKVSEMMHPHLHKNNEY